jgi:predicted ATP-grasp superfamily ATP-dependent carboligase
LALSRSLGRHGIPVFRFHPERSQIDLESRFCTHVPCPNLYDAPEALIQFLLEFSRTHGGRPVLFPAADGAVEFVAQNEERLGRAFALACPSWECVRKVQNKQALLEHARDIGVPIPATAFPKSSAEVETFAAALEYPAIVKPLTSHHWKRPDVAAVVRNAKAIVVNNAAELVTTYLRWRRT